MTMKMRLALGASTLLISALIAGAAFGASGDMMSVGVFRQHPHQARIYMVVGALNVTNSVDLVCPQPITVGELEAALVTRTLPTDKAWVQAMVELMSERGCSIKSGDTPNT
jgi:hypothetical protein